MVRRLLFEGTLNRFTAVSPCHDTGLGQHGMKRQSRGLDVHTGESSQGTEAGQGLTGASAQAPPVTEEEAPQRVNLFWVTQGRATSGTGAARSQPSASPLQELPPAPHPVPALPGGSPPSTAVSSPGSKQLLEANPPTFSPGKMEASNIRGLAEQGPLQYSCLETPMDGGAW